MILDKRRAHLLSIIQHADDPVSTRDLIDKMKVSQRTIYYDIDQINNWLVSQSLDPIQSKHGRGLFLPPDSKAELYNKQDWGINDWQYQLSKQERETLIKAKILLEDQDASMEQFMNLTSMSRGTIAKVLKSIKQDFKEAGLDLQYKKNVGYQLTGSEEEKRKMLSNILATIFSQSNWQNVRNKIHQMIQPEFENSSQETELRDKVKKILFDVEKELGLTLTDEMVEILSFQVLMVIKRIERKKYISVHPEEKKVLQQTTAYQGALLITKSLENWRDMDFPEDEICFITMNLLGSKVQHEDFSHYSEQELSGLREVVHLMMNDFQIYSCVVFDDKDGLTENLISHIKPTYYRLKYGVKIANDLAFSIQETYPDIFHLTKKVMKHLEVYVGKKIPDEEVAYITLHFGGWITKEKKKVETKLTAIIVCENGIGTSNMLRSQLENLITGLTITDTLSMREYQRRHYSADVIFSTNFIKKKDTPVVHVPAILTNYEKQRIIQRMNELFGSDTTENDPGFQLMEVIERHAKIYRKEELKEELIKLLEQNILQTKEPRKPMLNELLTEKTIRFKDRISDWEEAITEASTPLLDQHFIRQEYVQAMIENVKELGPYIVIAPRIAIPHARPEAGVEKLGMSLLRLKEPVYFSDKEKHRAQLIIVLAAIDNQTHLKALAQLTGLLSEEKNVDRLIAADNAEAVIQLINQTVEV